MQSGSAITAHKLISKPKTKSKTKKNLAANKVLVKIAIVLLVIVAIVGGGIFFSKAYQGKIYPKITIAGVKVGGLTIDAAKTAVNSKAQELNAQGPVITYNSTTIKPKLDELGVSFNVDSVVSDAFKYGRQGSLKQKITENIKLLIQGHQVEISPVIDETKFNQYLSQLAKVAEKEPVNANLVINQGVITTSPSEVGRGLDKDKLKKELTDFINSGKDEATGQISMVTADLEPQIKEDGTTDAKAQAEKFLTAAPLSVTFGTNTWTADRAEIGTWIKFSPSGNKLTASVDPTAFVNWIANKVEIPAKDRQVQDGTGQVLAEGQDGLGVDKNTLIAQLKDAVVNTKPNSSFALVTFAIPRGQTTVYPDAMPGRFPGRYIDINLSKQTLYAFEGSNLVNQFLISSGIKSHPTITGLFYVYAKDRYALMHGTDYYLPNVPYVSWYSGDYSIHGTYWHHNFGHVMSHGCINMYTPDAEWIYGWDSIGTPVFIHY